MVHVRRLVKAGNVSHTVSLPVKWLERNNLKRGDTVYIHEKGASELVILPHLVQDEKQQKEKTIEIENKSPAIVAREITSCYINNYTSVVLIGDVQNRMNELRNVVARFSAFEITEQTPKRLVMKDLLNVKEVSVDSTLNRMDMILRSMFQDLIKGVSKGEWDESLSTRDADMDKFYFLIYRLVKTVMKDASVSNVIDLSSHQAFEKWMLTNTLEAMGDHCKDLAEGLKKLPKSSVSSFSSALEELQELYLDSIKAYNLQDAELAHKVADGRPAFADKLSKLIIKADKANTVDALKSMQGLLNLVGDLTRLTLDSD